MLDYLINPCPVIAPSCLVAALFCRHSSDRKPGRGDRLAPAEETPAGRRQTVPLLKDKSAFSANRRLNQKFALRQLGPRDMGQVFIDLPFPYPHRLGKIFGREFPVFQEGDNGLTNRAHQNLSSLTSILGFILAI
jgi:hypothetical protein